MLIGVRPDGSKEVIALEDSYRESAESVFLCPTAQVSRPALSPEEIAKTVTDKRTSPVGQPTKVDLPIKVVVPRAAAERLTARAIRETRKLESVIAEILERGAK